MATLTPNLSLVKPSSSDNVDINVLNQNFELIDSAITDLKTDYIISQGVSGRFMYRKYASGMMECWGNMNHANQNVINTYGNLFYAGLFNVDLPNAFKTIYNITATVYASNNGLYGASVRSFTNSSVAYFIFSAKKETKVNIFTQLHVLGLWK